MSVSARDRFLDLLRTSVRDGSLVKLTLGKYRGTDATLQNIFVRPVDLKSGPHLAFVTRHATRDVTKNFAPEAAVAEIERLLGSSFLDAHLFTTAQTAQFESEPGGIARLKVIATTQAKPQPETTHDRAKHHVIPADAPWLRALGVTNERGQPREGMADKFRQIQKFAELLQHLIADAFPAGAAGAPLQIVDMGSGKGYLTFAIAALLGDRAVVRGVEVRSDLVDLCNRVARDVGLDSRLTFAAGAINDAAIGACDILIALHACDTATDDALARGISAGATLLVVAPCCQKELRSQLTAPPVLADALRHGIFQERQSEFVTDALRAQLLEWAGYHAKVFEFISTEHTAKNVMITASKAPGPSRAEARANHIRDFAGFYGIRSQRLAQHLGFALGPPKDFVPEIT
jgi:hypothetical protein